MTALNRLPSLDELKQFAVNRPDEFEITRQTLYDEQTYLAAGQTILTFFQDPLGQGGKTKQETNIESAGQLPAPKYFLIESIELRFYPTENPVTVATAAATPAVAPNFTNDWYAFSRLGFLDLFIGSKSYLTEAPLDKFPPKTCLKPEFAASIQVGQAVAADLEVQITMDYACTYGRPYFIDPQITLIPNQNFNITLNWPAVVPLPSTNTGRVNCTLDGLLYRLSQ